MTLDQPDRRPGQARHAVVLSRGSRGGKGTAEVTRDWAWSPHLPLPRGSEIPAGLRLRCAWRCLAYGVGHATHEAPRYWRVPARAAFRAAWASTAVVPSRMSRSTPLWVNPPFRFVSH